eukprot:scpid80519/ scgid18427/ 
MALHNCHHFTSYMYFQCSSNSPRQSLTDSHIRVHPLTKVHCWLRVNNKMLITKLATECHHDSLSFTLTVPSTVFLDENPMKIIKTCNTNNYDHALKVNLNELIAQ